MKEKTAIIFYFVGLTLFLNKFIFITRGQFHVTLKSPFSLKTKLITFNIIANYNEYLGAFE